MPSKDKIAKNKKTIAKVSALSGLAALSIGTGAILSSCSGVAWNSTIQIVVSDASSTLADQSFSESAYNGLRNFYKGIGVGEAPEASSNDIIEGNGLWKRPGSNDASRIQTYENIKNEGSNIVLATGFNQGDALQQITSTDPKFAAYKNSLKDTGFVFVDGALQKSYKLGEESINSDPTNVSSIAYRADEGSFLVGLSTAVYLNENWKLFHDGDAAPTEIGVSGFVGLAIPSTVSFLNGFRQGLIYWNSISSLIKLDDNTNSIKMKWISPTNSTGDLNIGEHATGSFDANEQKATELTATLIKNGAKVIFPIAGPQTQLVVNKVVQEQKNVAVIGVDTAQENITNLQKPLPKPVEGQKAQNIIPFSSLKDITYSSQQVLNAIQTGQESNGYKGFGYNNLAGLNNKGVGISDAGKQYLIDPLFFSGAINNGGTGGSTAKEGSEGSSGKTYDISNLLNGSEPPSQEKKTWKLSELKRGSDSSEYEKIYKNYQELLSTAKIKYKDNVEVSYKITGSELTQDAKYPETDAQKLLPKFDSKNAAANYTIAAAFGGDATTQVSTGTPLDGTKWTYALSKK